MSIDVEKFNAVVERCDDAQEMASDSRLKRACLAYFIHGMNELQDRLRAAEAELQKARSQEPYGQMWINKDIGTFVRLGLGPLDPVKPAYITEVINLYAAPVPAQLVPDTEILQSYNLLVEKLKAAKSIQPDLVKRAFHEGYEMGWITRHTDLNNGSRLLPNFVPSQERQSDWLNSDSRKAMLSAAPDSGVAK